MQTTMSANVPPVSDVAGNARQFSLSSPETLSERDNNTMADDSPPNHKYSLIIVCV
jgi:hypothetical protein